MSRFRHTTAFVLAIYVAFAASNASADPRPFTFTTDAYPMGKGDWEYEQWITWKGGVDADKNFNRFDIRHEFEFGLADNFDLAIYMPEWRYEDSDSGSRTHFEGGSIETVFYLTNPATDFLGFGLYNEIGVGEDSLRFEQKLILHKDIGRLTLAYNLVFETEIEGVFNKDEENEVKGELANTFGVSYALTPQWKLGGELVVASEFIDWEDHEVTTVYAGPVVSYQGGKFGKDATWWATFTPMFQLTDENEEPDFQFRLLAGLNF
jgi:hypothetical protein